MALMDLIKPGFELIRNLKLPEQKPYWQVQHFDQKNNPVYGWKECFPVSVAMRYCFNKEEKPENWDAEFVQKILDLKKPKINGYEVYQVHSFWIEYMQQFGYLASEAFAYNEANLKKRLDERPVIIGTYLTHSGHMTLAVGYSKTKKGYWINDPYGKYPYQTIEEKNWKEPYFIDGDAWLKDTKGNPLWCLDIK